MNKPLHPIFWLWIPVAVFIAQLVLEFTLTSDILAKLHTENGPHETAQFIIIFAALLLAIKILAMKELKATPMLYAWVGAAAIGSFYVAGEEISWGQHILDWSTPEYWQNVNDQGETNLHNTSSWLDQKPRLILETGVLIGGLIIPALMKFKPQILPQKFNIIYPSAQLGVIALFVLVITVLEKVDDALSDVIIFERASEIDELYLFYFVLLYLWGLRSRIMQHKG